MSVFPWRRLATTAVVLVLTSAATLGVMWLSGSLELSPSRKPYTLEFRERSFSEGEIQEIRVVRALRSDGSRVTARYYPAADGSSQEMRAIVDLDRGKRTTVASITGSTTTIYYSPEQIASLRRHVERCPRGPVEKLPVMGFSVIADVAEPLQIETETFSRTAITYVSPDIGCAAVGNSMIRIDRDGSQHEFLRTELVAARLGEPEPALFEIPPAYVELSPSEFAIRSAIADSIDVDAGDADIVQQVQSQYETNQSLYAPTSLGR